MLLHDLMQHAARYSKRRIAVVDGTVERNYGDTGARVERAASGLIGLGLAPGSHVALLSANNSFFFEAYFACSRADLVAVPINTRLAAAEIAFIMKDSDCRAILYDESGAALLPNGDDRLLIRAHARISGSGPAWDALIESATAAARLPDTDDNSTAHICYTGGTTGRPKGVMLSHRNVVASAFNKIVLGGFNRDDVWLHAAPMFHQADSWACFTFTALGAKHVFIPRFDAANVLQMIERHRITALQLVPTMIVLLLETLGAKEFDLRSVRRLLYSSAPMPVDLLNRSIDAFGPVLQHIYGLTEAAGTIAAQPWPAQPDESSGSRLTSCGQPLPGVHMRIADNQGHPLADGIVGNIQVRSETVMQGYYNRPAETAATFVDGWLDTGDLGRMDAEGFVFIVDRAKDMIISGGENVYSTEVEHVLNDHPEILACAVIGLPHPRWGEAVTAVVETRRQATVTEKSLIEHCRQSLAGYKCPKAVFIRGALPKSGAGKILKPVLRKELNDTFAS